MAIQSALPFHAVIGASNISEQDIKVPTADSYTVQATLTLPSVAQGNGQSAVITTVLVNSTTKYTSTAGDLGLKCIVACSAGDTIKIITASSQSNDNAINAIRLTATIDQGVI